MDPITIAAALANLVPTVLHLFGHDTAANTAQNIVNIAQAATGAATPEAALQAIKTSPGAAAQFNQAIVAEKVRLADIDARRAAADAAADNEADKLLTDRMSALDGTASDLKAIPYAGPVMLFVRGSQRIIISYGTAWLDYLYLTGAMPLNDIQSRMIFTATMLVFIVLFGERAVKNVAPLVIDLLRPGQQAGGSTGKG